MLCNIKSKLKSASILNNFTSKTTKKIFIFFLLSHCRACQHCGETLVALQLPEVKWHSHCHATMQQNTTAHAS